MKVGALRDQNEEEAKAADQSDGNPSHESPVVDSEEQAGATGVVEADDEESREAVESPGKVMRIGTMIKQLLEEVRGAPLDERSRERLREIYETSVKELAEGISPDLREELDRLVSPFAEDSVPSDAELRIAQAQLVGWLEGLFHGIQATLFAQQVAARNQLEQMGRRGLPQRTGNPAGSDEDNRPGTYL